MEEGRFASNDLDSPTKIAKQTELNTLRDSVFTKIIMAVISTSSTTSSRSGGLKAANKSLVSLKLRSRKRQASNQ
ncbi:hypothetical protein J43TS9_42490 [Paenibacillus cineris]|uniref:hypothetical protein n=1 Tax=Paenibacillus favisporus TaxID=221028 RepID=UPI0013D72238|nr:hypothetical protein [Paenibacillus favisporus]GIO62675.1 hypothetical protein J43TS9_42490 [Paenibacillus cineris]